MSLRQKQSDFAKATIELLKFIGEQGYEWTYGDTTSIYVGDIINYLESSRPYVPDNMLERLDLSLIDLKKIRHRLGSFHFNRLAIDINLFRDGKYLDKTEDHRVFGEYWKTLGGTWGGDFRRRDGNHYSWGEI